jgi:N-acetylmuramoyl-L-alanine amidase
MATPMTAAQTVKQLKKWGIATKEVPGWEHHNRAGHGDWGPVNGFMIHHTGDDAADSADLNVIHDGRADLPGPLAQFGCDDDGTIWLVGHGRANHAGGGDPQVLSEVIAESYGDRPSAPHFHEGSPGATDGNVHFYGVETFYSGKKKMTREAYKAVVTLSAAICDFHDWTARSVIGHKEWSDDKVDPGHVDMKVFRQDVAAALAAGPGGGSDVTPPPHETSIEVQRARVLLRRAVADQPPAKAAAIDKALKALEEAFT